MARYPCRMARFLGLFLIASVFAASQPGLAGERVTGGLLVLYDFEEGAGTTIRDRSAR